MGTPGSKPTENDFWNRNGAWFTWGMLLLCLGYAVYAASHGWDHTINDRHSFRQSQTATTALFLIQAPFRLAYETPVLGKPWSIPMEFPFYQWIVAKVIESSGAPLDQSGRLVSLSFFLLTSVPLFFLFRQAGVPLQWVWVPLCLFLLSPFYIFWSRTFMMESTALFLSVSYLAASARCLLDRGRAGILLAMGCGIGAALAKVTTFLGYLPLVLVLLAQQGWLAWRKPRDLRAIRRISVLFIPLALVPLVMAFLWVHYSDGVKASNPLAAEYLISTSPHNSAWNYGTWDQKLSGWVWGVILSRFTDLWGLPQLAWLLLGAVVAITFIHGRRARESFGCLAAYLLAPAVFTNVHLVHDYYSYANGVFLLGALAFALVGLLEEDRTRLAGWVFLLLFGGSAVLGHRSLYLPVQEKDNREILEIAEQIRSLAPENSVLICIGNDWSPLVSYYARRRSLNFPINDRTSPARVAEALASLRGEMIGAIVLVEPVTYPRELAMEQLRAAGIAAPVLHLKNLPRF